MAENYENSNENWVHVDAYTRDDGTQVSEYWRRKRGSGDFAPPNPLSRINTPYNYQLGEIVPPYLQSNVDSSISQKIA